MTRMRTRLRDARRLAWLSLSMVVAAGAVHAQDGRIGVVNVQRLLEQAPQTQRAMTALQEEFAPRQRDLLAMQQSLQGKQETYQRDQSVMGADERAKLEREIREGTRDLQRADEELQEDATIRRNEILSQLQGMLLQAVQSHAREEGYDLIITDYVYVSAAMDITDDVLASMREQDEQGAGR